MNCNTYAQRVNDEYTTQAYRERLGAFAKLIDDFMFILSFVGKDAGRDPEWWDTHLLSYPRRYFGRRRELLAQARASRAQRSLSRR
jgi:hypothetical protein